MPRRGRYYYKEDITSSSPGLANVSLPDKIRCDRCNKWKGQSNFARKRLNDLRQKFLNNKGPFTAQCTLCVPLQLVELTCFMCGKDKGLEGFSKAQRKKADYAKCNECMKEQLNIQPLENQRTYHGEVVTNSDSDEEDGSSDDEEYQDVSSVISTYPESSAGKATGNLVGAFDELSVNGTVSVNDMGSTTTGGFWRPLRDRSAAGGSAANMAPAGSTGCSASYAASAYSAQSTGKSGTTTGGFDPMKYGHPRVASVADSMETNCPASSSGGKWAKVRAYQPDPDPEPEPEENVWGEGEDEYESSSEDESEDEYPIMSSRR